MLILFCIFHACVGFILPSLARLRTMWVAGPSTIEFKLLTHYVLFTKLASLQVPAKWAAWGHDELFAVISKCCYLCFPTTGNHLGSLSVKIFCAQMSTQWWQPFLSPCRTPTLEALQIQPFWVLHPAWCKFWFDSTFLVHCKYQIVLRFLRKKNKEMLFIFGPPSPVIRCLCIYKLKKCEHLILWHSNKKLFVRVAIASDRSAVAAGCKTARYQAPAASLEPDE